MVDVPIFGRISVLKLFRPREERKDLLFLLTERYKFCVLEFDETTGGQGGDSGRGAAAQGNQHHWLTSSFQTCTPMF